MMNSFVLKMKLALFAGFLIISTFIHTAGALPVLDHRNSRQTSENNGFPSNVVLQTQKAPNNSCFINVTEEFMEEVPSPDNPHDRMNKTKQRVVRKCCNGYTGTECNIIEDPYLASNPCNGQTCTNFPNATCSVISQCDEDLAVFLDNEGNILECDSQNEDYKTNITTTLSCIGYCAEDPCAGLTCQAQPSAMCLTIGCSCEAIWLLDTGVSVDCTTGQPISPEKELRRTRRRREAESSETGCLR
jgi:hypothetical protein